MITHENPPEKAYLIGLKEADSTDDPLSELRALVLSLGYSIGGEKIFVSRRDSPSPLTSGRLAEAASSGAECDLYIFDFELSPSAQKQTSEVLAKPCLDRHEIILDIFRRHAGTKEAFIQIELARLEYILPRLKRSWTHFSRQRGGTQGNKGPGETQLEIDRRKANDKIIKLKKELKVLGKQGDVRKSRRQQSELKRFCLVGYTNVGKSSLMKIFSGADVKIKDDLFVTLSTTTRRCFLMPQCKFLLSDTVGFISHLPHHLIDAFHSTLSEAIDADVLIHVIDVSSPDLEFQIDTTKKVLADLGIDEKPAILVFNKIDRLHSSHNMELLKTIHPDGVFVSAVSKEGIDELKKTIKGFCGMPDETQESEYSDIPITKHASS